MTDNEKLIEHIKQLTKKFMETDDIIRQKSKELSELKKQKKIMEINLYDILNKSQIDEIQTGVGKLQKTQSVNKVPMSKNFIEDVLKNKVGDDNTVSEIMSSLKNREKISKKK